MGVVEGYKELGCKKLEAAELYKVRIIWVRIS